MRPRATAAAFLPSGSGVDSTSSISPVAILPIMTARCIHVGGALLAFGPLGMRLDLPCREPPQYLRLNAVIAQPLACGLNLKYTPKFLELVGMFGVVFRYRECHLEWPSRYCSGPQVRWRFGTKPLSNHDPASQRPLVHIRPGLCQSVGREGVSSPCSSYGW